MKIDPYGHEKTYYHWKANVQNGIPTLCDDNSALILRYLSDMQKGLNISSSSSKGSRSYSRLNNLRLRMMFLAKHLKKSYGVNLADITEEQIFSFFNDMRNGTIKRKDGKTYKSVVDFVKTFKAFWHWYIKINEKEDVVIKDITKDLDTSGLKAKWVYLTEEQIKLLCENAKWEYRVLIMFIFDTGIRSPSELINIRISDLYNDFKELHIRDEIVKKGSFGRKVKLMLCSDMLRKYVSINGLEDKDRLFNIIPRTVNQYLQRLAKKVLGEGESLAGEKYSSLTMYDFRHCSCCYWLPRYKSESALKYRFGWKKSDKIHYYSELLGMKDTISEEDMLIDMTKTEIERRLIKTEQEYNILKEKSEVQDEQISTLSTLIEILAKKLEQLGVAGKVS
jgi:integrase